MSHCWSEPSVADALADPLIRALMAADAVHPAELRACRDDTGAVPSGTHPVINFRERLRSKQPQDFAQPALPTAAPASAVQPVLFAASGVIANQRLEHSCKPHGKPFGSDTLRGDAGALTEQEDFVGETLGIGELGIPAQANKPLAERRLMLADDTSRRMVLVRQLDGSVGERTTAVGLVLLEVSDMAQPSQELAFRITRMGIGDHTPGSVKFLRELAETRGDQHILRGEVAIERHLVGAGRFGDRVDADGMDAAAIEQPAGCREDALSRSNVRVPRRSGARNNGVVAT